MTTSSKTAKRFRITNATSWSSRKRAERVLEQAIAQYPKSDLMIVED